MRITREPFSVETEGTILTVQTCYTCAIGNTMVQEYSTLEASDTFGAIWRRYSSDGGRTWSPAERWFSPRTTPAGVLRYGESTLTWWKAAGTAVYVGNRHCYPQGTFSKEALAWMTLAYAFLDSTGRSDGEERQLIAEGMDSFRWMPDVEQGRNGMMISFCNPEELPDGTLVVPAQSLPPDMLEYSVYRIPLAATCLIGRFRAGQVEWRRGGLVKLPREVSPRGIFEPSIVRLKGGALLMVCRASNSGAEHMPGYKWRSISFDQGESWSAPIPFTYCDGAPFFSPSSGSRLIRHSGSRRLYWIGNICAVPPKGNLPRHPLFIGEVNEMDLTLIRSSVRMIDQRQPEDDDDVQLSNFKVYEDRETGEFVLTLTRLHERGPGMSSTWQYRIRPGPLPDQLSRGSAPVFSESLPAGV